MGNVAGQKKQTETAPTVAHAVWDPFWFVREMFRWGRSGDGPSFDVKETDGAYIYKVKLTVPDQADVARMKAEFANGELTLVVPKVEVATPEPLPLSSEAFRTTKNSHGSAPHTHRHGTRSPSRHK